MANSLGPNIKRTTSKSTFYEVRGTASNNSNRNAVGLNYPLFILGILITALVIYILRARKLVEGGLVTIPEALQIEQVPNITQRLIAQSEGIYEPQGSAMSSNSYPGVPN